MSSTLSWIFLVFGGLLLGFGWLWMTIVAFQRSTGWGLFVLLFPLAGLLFIFKSWEDARRPFATQLIGLTFCGVSLLSSYWPALLSATRAKFRSAPTQIATSGAPAPAVDNTARQRVSERLAALKMQERQLLARKAKLDPADTAAAHALAEDVRRYNVELKAAQEEQRALDSNRPTAAPGAASR
jgi:hypothetical protein